MKSKNLRRENHQSPTLLTTDMQPLTRDHKYGCAQAKMFETNALYDKWIKTVAENHCLHTTTDCILPLTTDIYLKC